MTAHELGMRISGCLAFMERGGLITLPTGHRLAVADGHVEPGFLATRHWSEGPGQTSKMNEEEMIFQIGSDVAWLSLVAYAKKMGEKELKEMLTK